MIRLNQASVKRRPPRSSGDDNSISDLIGNANGTTGSVEVEGGVTPEADRLFEELLGENSSGIASKKEKDDDESSAMSSIFSGLMDKYKKNNGSAVGGFNGIGGELGRISETNLNLSDSQEITEAENNLDHNNEHETQTKPQDQLSKALSQSGTKDDRTENEEDTLITKPREISFDPLSDDVSALFGGGGVSTADQRDGVESYMGTFTKQRHNRRTPKVSGLFGNFGAIGSYNSFSNRRKNEESIHASSRQSEVDSILEDIGVRSSASKSLLTDDFQDGEENKGHNARRHFRSVSRRRKGDSDLWRKLLKGNQSTLVLVVLIIYVVLQIPTVQKHDRLAMKKIKSQRHKYDRFDNGGNYDDGTGEGHELRREGMQRRERELDLIEEEDRDLNANNMLRGGLRQNEYEENRKNQEVVDGPTDDMTITSKQNNVFVQKLSQNEETGQFLLPEHDDTKAALMRPPEDPPSMTERHEVKLDKLDDIDPIKDDQIDPLPSKFKAFASVKTPYVMGRDTPFFWHIPRSGGVIVKTLMSHCLKMTLAAEVGELEGHDKDEELKVVTLFDHNYTNVNVATADGINRALSLGLVPSHLADVIVSSQVDKISSLFTSNEHARAFSIIRNPVDRAVSMFYFLKSMGNERMKNMTLEEYAKSDMIENNWLVRILSGSMTGSIDSVNLETAQRILKEKFVVGILENKRGSFARFDHYFKWKENPNYEKEFGCIKQIMDEKYVSKHPLRKGDATWNLIFEQNRFDMLLYEYAKNLFKEQSSYIFGL